MKNIVCFTLAAAVLLSGAAFSDSAVASPRSDWITGAMSAADSTPDGDGGLQTSQGEVIGTDDFLPESSQADRDTLGEGSGAYGDDVGLMGAAHGGNQSLASQGDSTEAGVAYQIVNQPVGHESSIEHRIYQHSVLYSHDLASNLDESYLGFAWADLGASRGTESGGGDGFFITDVPPGKTRSMTAMLAAPIKYEFCDEPQIKITGGTAWVPGCGAGGANCERIIKDPLSSSMYEFGPWVQRQWYWLDADGDIIRKIDNSEGGVNVMGRALLFPIIQRKLQTSLTDMTDEFGVRKIEASGICIPPNVSTDSEYLESLPSCNQSGLVHGQACGKVVRTSINFEENPFEGMDIESALADMTSDCVMQEETVTSEIEITDSEEKFCGRSGDASFEGCSITHDISAERVLVWEGDPAVQVERINVSDSWSGSRSCKNLIQNIETYESACTYEVTINAAPNCRVIDGVSICRGSQAYNQLEATPGGYGNKLTRKVTISDVDCDIHDGEIELEGETFTLEPFDNCTELQEDPSCSRRVSQCVNETETNIGDWCSEYEDMYKCNRTIEGPSTQTKTKMVCGNQDFYCVDGSCLEQQPTLQQEGFGEAAATLSAVQGIASHTECEDPTRAETCKVFAGKAQSCRKGRGKFAELWNCCDEAEGGGQLESHKYVEGILQNGKDMAFIGPAAVEFFRMAAVVIEFLVPCNVEEAELAGAKEIDSTIYIGSFCGRKVSLGFTKICVRKDRSYCAWPTPLGKVIMEQALPQIGGSLGSPKNPTCNGMTITQLQSLDWDQIDLSEWAGKLAETGNLPQSGFGDFDASSMSPNPTPGGDW